MIKWFKITFVLAVVMILAACGESLSDDPGQTNEQGGSNNGELTLLDKIKEQGTVKIGFANEKPFAYSEGGHVTGEAVEIAKAIMSNLGVDEIDDELNEFGALINGLQSKNFDMITAGMFIDADRCTKVAFANPEYRVGAGLAVASGNPLNLSSYEDIANQSDAKVAVMTGGIEEKYMLESGVSPNQIIVVPDQPSAIAQLRSGAVDAITMTEMALIAMLESADDDSLEKVDDFQQPIIDGEEVWGYGATAFRLDDVELRDAFNEELEKLKESGELLEILEKFGFGEHNLPGDVTAEQLCQS